ncbi:MAG: RHS repeat-associated core domain-containing protein [Candidatus Saccharicenans sp.]|jgi:RHS repeat-associated protein|nr:RHS repeat-associated core domain-containing protein [Candidatus Saccharicenans sp.]MDH7575819.1 RHS repeat-associated core domain-containing protein [Candidatus Saccharicenans sp.]
MFIKDISESSLYYFGARYYDPALYRFLSPDPVIPTDRALYNPQRWNLYGYCLNNPLNLCDPDGRASDYVHYDLTYKLALEAGIPEDEARIIAEANRNVDKDWRTSSFNPLGRRFHYPDAFTLNWALDIAYNTKDPVMLGFALHVIQDAIWHFNWLFNPLGHLIESVGDKVFDWICSRLGVYPDIEFDPDSPYSAFISLDILWWVRYVTFDILQDYKARKEACR